MPPRGGLTQALISTGNAFSDTLDNLEQLVGEHLDILSVKSVPLVAECVVKYDEIKVYNTPWVSIVFETARTLEDKINRCVVLGVDVTLFFYFESLSFGNDTYEYVKALYRFMEIFLVHFDLYGLTAGTSRQTVINNCSLVGRVLDSGTFLTGQISLTANIRHCRDDHAEE